MISVSYSPFIHSANVGSFTAFCKAGHIEMRCFCGRYIKEQSPEGSRKWGETERAGEKATWEEQNWIAEAGAQNQGSVVTLQSGKSCSVYGSEWLCRTREQGPHMPCCGFWTWTWSQWRVTWRILSKGVTQSDLWVRKSFWFQLGGVSYRSGEKLWGSVLGQRREGRVELGDSK